MTDPRLTLDDLCGVEGHPVVRHECWQADKALGIRRCPVHTDEWADRISGFGDERMNGDPRWRCHAATHPYEQHPFMLVCERGHVIHPSEVETAEREDERLRDQARQIEDDLAGLAMARGMGLLPNPGKPSVSPQRPRPVLQALATYILAVVTIAPFMVALHFGHPVLAVVLAMIGAKVFSFLHLPPDRTGPR